MSFTAAAIAGGLQDTYASHPTEMVDSGLYLFARETLWRLSNIFAVKMSAVFMLSLGTIWLRTRAMPRFFAVITYSMAVVMLFSISLNLWATMLFPIWVFLVSLRILKVNRLGRAAPASVGVGED
jgi:hypothetical protein